MKKHHATLAAAGMLASLLVGCASGFTVDNWHDYLWGLPKYQGNSAARSPDSARIYFLPKGSSTTDRSATLEFRTSESWQFVIDGARVSASAWQRHDDAGASSLSDSELPPNDASRYVAWLQQGIPRYVPVTPGTRKIEIHWYRRTSTWDMVPLDADSAEPKRMSSREVPTWVSAEVDLEPGEIWLLAPQLSSERQRRGNSYLIEIHAFSLGSAADGVKALPDPKGKAGIAGIKGPPEWRRAVYSASVAIERALN